jgi:hypothetical protein
MHEVVRGQSEGPRATNSFTALPSLLPFAAFTALLPHFPLAAQGPGYRTYRHFQAMPKRISALPKISRTSLQSSNPVNKAQGYGPSETPSTVRPYQQYSNATARRRSRDGTRADMLLIIAFGLPPLLVPCRLALPPPSSSPRLECQ